MGEFHTLTTAVIAKIFLRTCLVTAITPFVSQVTTAPLDIILQAIWPPPRVLREDVCLLYIIIK